MNKEQIVPEFLSERPDGLYLAVKAQPRAAKSEIGTVLGGELRVKIAAPPVDSAANEALILLLAKTLDCARSRVEMVRGHTSRHKVIKLHGFDPNDVVQKLKAKCSR